MCVHSDCTLEYALVGWPSKVTSLVLELQAARGLNSSCDTAFLLSHLYFGETESCVGLYAHVECWCRALAMPWCHTAPQFVWLWWFSGRCLGLLLLVLHNSRYSDLSHHISVNEIRASLFNAKFCLFVSCIVCHAVYKFTHLILCANLKITHSYTMLSVIACVGHDRLLTSVIMATVTSISLVTNQCYCSLSWLMPMNSHGSRDHSRSPHNALHSPSI